MTRNESPTPASQLDSDVAPTQIASTGDAPAQSVERPLGASTFADRYGFVRTLGEGGMGNVLLFEDRQIGRHVALKMIRREHAERASIQARFLREARIQGQLEHPSIVPVYDLGADPEGTAYFTMKRVQGDTLRDVINGLASNDSASGDRFSRRRLLTAFSNVCLAIDFAHQRGVVHRDLKPENVMLGGYGEVYVLDWGLLKLLGQEDDAPASFRAPKADPSKTMPGALLGTPGYIAPEQLRGDTDVGPHTDVYALGAILFELLTWQRLHEGKTTEALVTSTLEGANARPTERAPDMDVPPELEAICERATASSPADRYGSARDLYRALERYLDGERDVERRRELAAGHAKAAQDAALRARTSDDSIDQRREAMRNIGRALALDPTNADALDTMVALLTEPPAETPPEVTYEMTRSQEHHTKWTARIGGYTYLGLLIYLPIVMWLGIVDWLAAGLFFAGAVSCAALSFWTVARPDPRLVVVVMIVSSVTLGVGMVFFGPFIIVPMAVAVNTTAFAVQGEKRFRPIAMGMGCLAILVPVVLQAAGVLSPSYGFQDGMMIVLESSIRFPEIPTLVTLTLSALTGVLAGGFIVGHVRDALSEAENQMYLYTWHLREFVPDTARAATDPTGARRARMKRLGRPSAR